MNIIGINGFKRSGKGETGLAIANLLGNTDVKLLGFADKLKVFAARSLGYTTLSDVECIALMDDAKETWTADIWRLGTWDAQTEGSAMRFGGPAWNTREPVKQWTVRQLLQFMGTEARTVFGDDFWVDQVLPQPQSALGQALGYEGQQHELSARYPGVATLVFTDLRFPNEAQRILDLGGYIIEVIRPGVTSDGHASELVLPSEITRHRIYNRGSLEDLRWEVNKVLELAGLMP